MSIGPGQRIRPLPKDQTANRERLRAARARQRAIGRELRRMFDDVAHAPLPEEFHELLRKIDAVAAQSLKRDENKKIS